MFKDKLKELREINNISQYQLADKIFVSRSAIAKWENGLGMPSSDSLDMLCKFFNVTKDELLDDNDSNIVLENVEKKSKKIITILIIILCAFVLTYCGIGVGYFIQEKMEEDYKIHDNVYFSEDFLAKYELAGLKMIESENYSMFGKNGSFHAYVDSYEIFEDYANYVYEQLKYSTSISYLSSAYLLNEYINIGSENMTYLILSENINDHVENITKGKATIYSFYYITEFDEKRESKDKVNANYVQLKYTFNGNQHIVSMTIKNTDDDEYNSDFYLSNEYFDLQKIRIDNDNVTEYFDIGFREQSIGFAPKKEYCLKKYGKWQSDFNPFFKLFVKSDFKLLNIHDFPVLKSYEISKYDLLVDDGYSIYCSYSDFGIEEVKKMDLKMNYTILNDSVMYVVSNIK